LTTKILALVDGCGNLVRFSLWPGQRHDSVGALDLIHGLLFKALLGDKAFDNNDIRDEARNRGAEAVIPSKADRKQLIPHDPVKYRRRHLIENYFSQIKDFRAVNTRYDKTDLSYKATINLAAIAIALR
jgi:transposase